MNILDEIKQLNSELTKQKEKYQKSQDEYKKIMEESKTKAETFEQLLQQTQEKINEHLKIINSLKESYQKAQDEYNRIMEEDKSKVAPSEQLMQQLQEQISENSKIINSLKEMWIKYSCLLKTSNIAEVLTKLIRKIEGNDSLQIALNEDMQFYDAELNWTYNTDYSYLKEFIDMIINKSITENKSEIDAEFLNEMLEEFLNSHQDSIKTVPPKPKSLSIWEELERLNEEIERQDAILHDTDFSQEPAKINEALKVKKQCLSQIKDLKKQWVTYSYFSKATNIIEVLTRLIRRVEGNNSLELNGNEDIRFYDVELNWNYYIAYPYIKEFIDEVIQKRIKAKSFYMSEKKLNTLLKSFLKCHPDLTNSHSSQSIQEGGNIMPSLSSFNLFEHLLDICAEQQMLKNEVNNTPRQKRYGEAYQKKEEGLEKINDEIARYSFPSLNTIILLLELMEGEEYAYKNLAICKVNHFANGRHQQTKYTSVIKDGESITAQNVMEKYPYLREFSNLFVNAQYTAAKLGLNYTTKQILDMTIKQFASIHQEQINAHFASSPNEDFGRK